jgi:hypothetical protein
MRSMVQGAAEVQANLLKLSGPLHRANVRSPSPVSRGRIG